MGIKGLSALIHEICPQAVKEDQIKNYFSRKIAIDANMSMYQFMISIRGTGMDLSNDRGEVTSHLQGLLYRTTKLMEYGIRPCYVFDGKPPGMKSGELEKRRERADDAQKQLEKAEEEGDTEKVIMFSKRTVRVTREQAEDAKKLLRLMGIPVIESPTEAESQCAAMARDGLVYATGTEDMDALTFSSPRLVRHLTFSEARKKPIKEFNLQLVLEGMDVTMDQFIDICILCGCDYTDTIRGIGPKKAYQMIKAHGNIEGVLKDIAGKKSYVVPENFLESVEQARKLFKEPEVTPSSEISELLKWTDPDEEGMVEFLVKEKQFEEERVRNCARRLRATRKQSSQGRLDGFFTVVKRKPAAGASAGGARKKKGNDKKGKSSVGVGQKRKR